jgi:hypothetical protein
MGGHIAQKIRRNYIKKAVFFNSGWWGFPSAGEEFKLPPRLSTIGILVSP